ncbi:ATP-binding cassette domain-containing protein [Ostreibacterium oceani]|uniref:ATP-binding cassette domain-containing protein n=1 Tax=Ostreibacterium oceani TaxID=2654998 RepID=A0A6N7ETZ1_9GAMM|nr:ATP-binding cassette domain-containing protein [Ostreibacterium oceani]MPV85892.1 ATP-binding cassette domain-containing protein [Ostreibacterium oceani]
MLLVDNLTKQFGNQPVLTGCHLEIAKGSLTAIIGPNGCGKSTLFNVLTGDLAADRGRVVFCGQDIAQKHPRQIARQGLLRKFQIPGVYANLTVAAHLQLATSLLPRQSNPRWSFFMRSSSRHKRRQNCAEVQDANIQTHANTLGLGKLWDTQAKHLSTGQKQRLELAMLLLLKPKLLLLDEPIAGMSAKEAAETLDLLKQLNADGLTIVVIEHNMDFVKRLTEDIAVLMSGQFQLRGHYDLIKADPNIRKNYLGTIYA